MRNTNRHSRILTREKSAEVTKERREVSLQANQLEFKQSLINKIFFPNFPDHYSLSKKLHISKHNTRYGAFYIALMDFISVVLCILFLVAEHTNSYHEVQVEFVIETILVFFLCIDSFITCYISKQYVKTIYFAMDVITVFPTFMILIYVVAAGKTLSYQEYAWMSLLKLVRALRLFRTLHLFKDRFKRIVFKLFLTFASLTFIASGFLHLFENVIPQGGLECQYINQDTDWLPSCSDVAPASEMTYCDCSDNHCELLYDVRDSFCVIAFICCLFCFALFSSHLNAHTAVLFILIISHGCFIV